MKKTFNVDTIVLKPFSQAERIAIANLTAGLMVLQSDGVAGIYIYNGTIWVYSGSVSQWITNGSNIYYNQSVGIGTPTPSAPLEVVGAIKFGSGTDLQVALDAKANTISAFNRQNQSYTISLADVGIIVEIDSIAATNVTIPSDTTVAFPIGTTITLAQFNTGQVTILAANGVTILSSSSRFKLTEQYSLCSLIKKAVNQWYLSGDLSL